MNRLFALAPFALLSTACAVRTPATALDAQSDVAPDTRELVLPSDTEAIAAWQLPTASPWSRYEKLTLLTYLADQPVTARMPDVSQLEVVQRAEQAAKRLAMVGVPENSLWIVDLRGAASVAFGATLSKHSYRPIAPVMTFNNWPAELEVVPAEQALAALVTMRPKPLSPSEDGAIPVFMLDAWRLAFRDSEPDPQAMDNRYLLLASDFPDAQELRARGISHVVYVVEDRRETSSVEDDMLEVALAYQQAGIQMVAMDLEDIESLAAPSGGGWAVHLDSFQFQVTWRSTIHDNVRFYQRARGGFGGSRAAPAGRGYTPAHPSVGGARTYTPAHPTTGGSHAPHSTGGGRAYSGASPHVSGHSGSHGGG
jgi:hypothetical protein